LEEKSRDDFKNKEHVIPELLGKFRNNLTLNTRGNEAVCNECNSDFGNSIELILARDSMEGYLRCILGVKKPEESKFFRNRRVRIKLTEGELKGAYVDVKYDKHSNSVGVELVNQVGLRRKNIDKLEFFRLENLNTKQEMQSKGYVTQGKDSIMIVCRHVDELGKIRELLGKKGFKITSENKPIFPILKNATVEAKATSIVDKIVLRAIAKIAFNYLAYTQGAPFALNENFNGIRKFIRYGISDGFKYVLVDNSPILENETRYRTRMTLGHIITINWDVPKTTIVSRVGIFNTLRYRIIFCKFFKGLYRPLAIGHHFDFRKKVITEIPHITKPFYFPWGLRYGQKRKA
jgi:hypothetical protein